MRLRLPLVAAFAAVVAAFAVTAATATAAPATGTISAPITAAQSGGVLSGVFQITGFTINQAGQLVANGIFNGTSTVNGVTQTLTNVVASSVVTNQAGGGGGGGGGGGCQILDLVLGPLHLDVLGLVVDLNQVHLNITAQPGPGNLLGNLLCGVVHLLDGTGSGNALTRLLDLLNGLLG